MSTMIKSRIEWVDVAKGLFMCFVILAHSGYTPSIYNTFYSPFFMAGFFVISGFLFVSNFDNINYKQKFANIHTSVLLPYLLYWAISYSVDQLLQGNYNFVSQLAYNILQGRKLWFVSALFISQLLALLYLYLSDKFRLKKCCIYVYLLPLVSLLIYAILPDGEYIWYFKTSFLASVYIGLGMILRLHSKLFTKMLNNLYLGFIAIILFLILIAIDIYVVDQKGAFHYGFDNMMYFFCESIIAIFAMFFVCSKIKKYNSLLIFIGSNSLLYYFFQNQVLRISKYIGGYLNISNPSYWYSIATVLFVIIILYFPIKMINSYFPIITGKYKIMVKPSKST